VHGEVSDEEDGLPQARSHEERKLESERLAHGLVPKALRPASLRELLDLMVEPREVREPDRHHLGRDRREHTPDADLSRKGELRAKASADGEGKVLRVLSSTLPSPPDEQADGGCKQTYGDQDGRPAHDGYLSLSRSRRSASSARVRRRAINDRSHGAASHFNPRTGIWTVSVVAVR
jgi:hypothetical protein